MPVGRSGLNPKAEAPTYPRLGAGSMSEVVVVLSPVIVGLLGHWLGRRDERRKWWPVQGRG